MRSAKNPTTLTLDATKKGENQFSKVPHYGNRHWYKKSFLSVNTRKSQSFAPKKGPRELRFTLIGRCSLEIACFLCMFSNI